MTYTINQDQLSALTNALENLDIEVDVRTDYSGRGMYGRNCLGFVVDSPARFGYWMGRVIANLEPTDEFWYDTVEEWADGVVDNMGLAHIVYFPSIQVES